MPQPKGKTGNPNGRPKGAKSIYTAQIKEVISKHFLEAAEGKKSELEKILEAISVDSDVNMSYKDKISASYDYFRLIAPQARDEGEIEQENDIKNALYDKFFKRNQ